MAMIGYARVSTSEQDLALQHDALLAAGCERIFDDHVSGVAAERPGLSAALAFLREEDVLVIWKFDRLGRSINHLIDVVGDLERRKVGLRSLTEAVDTVTPSGRLLFHIFGALAQFERDLIRERTTAGLRAAEARGRRGGRPAIMTKDKLARAKAHMASGLTVREAAARIKVSKSVLYQALSSGTKD